MDDVIWILNVSLALLLSGAKVDVM
jgi:hypothetical protein